MNRYIITIFAALLIVSYSSSQTLEDYLRMSAENNPGLKSVYKEYEAALQKIPQAPTLPDPTFSFGYFISPAETRLGPQQAKFSLTQVFPWFGTLKAQGNAAALNAEAKFQVFIEARNKLYFQVSVLYYQLYELENWIRIEQQNVNILESYGNIALKKYENGNGSMVDVLRTDIMLNDSETELEILKDKENSLLIAFNKLLNREMSETVEIPDSLLFEDMSYGYRKDSLLLTNPDIKALELKIDAAQASELSAKKQGLPKIGIGLDYIMVGERSDISMPDNGKDILMPMISLTIPLYRKKYNALEKESLLIRESYMYRKEDIANILVSNYEMASSKIEQQKQLLSLYEQQIHKSEQSIDLLLSAYGNSGKEFEEILRMQQLLLKYQKMRVSAETQLFTEFARINYLTAKTF